MEIDKPQTDYSYVSVKQIKNQLDQLSFYEKLTDQDNTLSNIIIFPHRERPDYVVKIPSLQLTQLQDILSKCQFQFEILPDLVYFFASNLPLNMNDQSIKKLLCKSYPKSTFSRLKKSPRCGFIGVPENLASSNDTFQAAQTSNEGIPFKLPSLPPIYLRPKRKKVKKRSQKTHPQPHLQQQFP